MRDELLNSESCILQIAGYQIGATTRTGSSGTLLCLLHGLGMSRRCFDRIFEVTDFSGYSVVAVDLLGHGDSNAGPAGSFELERHADAVLAVLHSNLFQYDRVHLVCHSMGGAVGVLVADHLQDPGSTFVNLEGNLIGADCGLVSRRIAGVSESEFISKLLPAIANEMKQNGEDPGDFLRARPEACYKTARSLVHWSDSERLLEKFQALPGNKYYVYGDRNHETEILKRLPPIPSYSIPESGHCMMLDNPADFYGCLARLLNIHS